MYISLVVFGGVNVFLLVGNNLTLADTGFRGRSTRILKEVRQLGCSPSDIANIIIKRNPIPPLDYSQLLWDEKEVKSVANITRKDAQYFLPLAAEIPIVPEVHEFKLEEANEALILLKLGRIQGTAVLRME